jgi:hypothetical protein
VRILLWDVHGGYCDALLTGGHDFLFLPARDGGGGLSRYADEERPPSAREATPEELRDDPPDLVLLQRTEEYELCRAALGLRPGVGLPAIFLEHNTPRADVPNTRHPFADSPGMLIVHVTHFNALMWDCGVAPTTVVEHGIPDPGLRYTGELARLAFVVNEPVRRWRVTGTDLLPAFAPHPVDAFGIDGDRLPAAVGERCAGLRFAGNVGVEELSQALSRRRVYLHLNRWTSLGLSLIQAMMLGMPVVVLDTTEASRAVPAEAGERSADLGELVAAATRLLADPDEAAHRGRIARAAALARYNLPRFLADWDAAFARAAALRSTWA